MAINIETGCGCPDGSIPITVCRHSNGTTQPPNIIVNATCENDPNQQPTQPQIHQSKGEIRHDVNAAKYPSLKYTIPAGVLRYSIMRVIGSSVEYTPPNNTAADPKAKIHGVIGWHDQRTTHLHQYVTPKPIEITFSSDAHITVAYTLP